MKRLFAAFGGVAVIAMAVLVTVPASGSKPATATISYRNATQVFIQSHTMEGGAPVSLVQTTCNTQPQACDPVTFTVDPTVGGKIDHFAVLELTFDVPSPSQMALAQYPDGCPEDSNPAGACATYLTPFPAPASQQLSFPDPGKSTYRLKVVCRACVNGTYRLTATLKHVFKAASLPPIGDMTPAFKKLQLPDPVTPPGLGGVAPGQLTAQWGEPGIWINQNGYGIVNTFGPTVWITKDGGKTFSKPYDILVKDTYCQSKYAGDADGIVGIDNTFYADNLCLGTDGAVNNESFYNTTGKDADWSSAILAGGVSDRQWYVVDPKNPNILYLSFHGFFAPDINIFKSTDKGRSFFCPETGLPVTAATSFVDCPVTLTSKSTPPVNTTYLDTGLGNVTTRPMIDPRDPNTIYVPYADTVAAHAGTASPARTDSDLTRFRMAVSHDGGKTWAANTDETGQGVVFDSEDGKYFPVTNTSPNDGTMDSTIAHIFIGSAIDRAGNLYILFSLRLGGTTPTHLYMMSSTNGGKAWSAPHQVDKNGLNSNVFPTMVAGDAGRVAMAWYGSKAKDFNDTGSQWAEMYSESVNALSAHPTFSQTRVSDASIPVHSADICQAGTFCAITGGNRNLADFQTIAPDPCGHSVIVYVDDHDNAHSHTVISRQTAGNALYLKTPKSCVGSASTPVSVKRTPRVLGEKQSGSHGKHLPATGLDDRALTLAGAMFAAMAAIVLRKLLTTRHG